MIVLNLSCGNQHSFEGWFASLEEFQRQSGAQQVTCPHCNDASITRLPTASHIRRAAADKHPSVVTGEPGNPAKIQAALEELLSSSDNVGANFPEEARKIHYEEIPARNIHGTASMAEVRSLLEEEIGVIPLPMLRKDIH